MNVRSLETADILFTKPTENAVFPPHMASVKLRCISRQRNNWLGSCLGVQHTTIPTFTRIKLYLNLVLWMKKDILIYVMCVLCSVALSVFIFAVLNGEKVINCNVLQLNSESLTFSESQSAGEWKWNRGILCCLWLCEGSENYHISRRDLQRVSVHQAQMQNCPATYYVLIINKISFQVNFIIS